MHGLGDGLSCLNDCIHVKMIHLGARRHTFSRSRCPFDDEGEECERPFCPFFHPFSRASNPLVKVKEEIQDDDIIVVYEKLIPSRSAFPSSATKSRVVSNTVEACQHVVSETSMLHKPTWSRPVIKRVRALKKLQLESLQVETQFYQKVYELEKQFQPLFDAVDAKIDAVVAGEHEPTDEEADTPLLHGVTQETLDV